MQEANGNRRLAAAALGITAGKITERIKSNAQLRALWGKAHEWTPDGPAVLNERDSMNRDASVIPLPPPATEPSKVELIDLVSKADYDLHRAKLGKIGLPPEVIEYLGHLETMAPSTAHMIAMSLELSHRDYHVTGLQLTVLLQTLWKRLMAKKEEAGYIEKNEERAFLMKVYIEGVKERGNAFTRMLTGAQAMVEMAAGASEDMPTGKRRKPGFGALAVNPPKKG